MTASIPNWQDALWAMVNSTGRWWDITIGLIALATSLGLFIKLILHQPLDLVVASRGVISLGLFAVFCNIFNSGWLKIGAAIIVLGMAMTYLLIITDWCHRPDKTLTVWRAMWRGAGRGFRYIYHHQERERMR